MVPILYFVVPCYKDETVIPITAPVFLKKLDELTENGMIADKSRLLLLNDCSPDGTWEALCALQETHPRVTVVNLAENVGEENALIAGMELAVAEGADCVITMDSDLQDDIETATPLIKKYLGGNDLVLGVRSSRAQDPLSERFFSGAFYFLMRFLRTGLVKEHSNYRLMSRRAVVALSGRLTRRFYLPVEICDIDLPRATVEYVRLPRTIGKSGYSFIRKTGLAIKAITCHAKGLPFTLLRRSERFRVPQPRYRIKEIRRGDCQKTGI